ncbi:MAG: hypothetical protein AAGA77_07240 [Bacteroidota bacterium]
MKYVSFFVLYICLLAVSCKTNDVLSPEQHNGNRLILKHGGGFTGAYTTYHVLDNGQLFKASNELEGTYAMNKLDRDIVGQIFSNYEILGMRDKIMESYNNLSYSLSMIDEKGEEHKLIWGKGQKGSESAQLFYDNVMNQIKATNKVEKETTR